MRKWWVGLVLLSVAVNSFAAGKPLRAAAVSPNLSVELTKALDIELVVTPHRGDAWSRLARRVTGTASQWRELAAMNNASETLTTDMKVRLPLHLARPEIQTDALAALFPDDQRTREGWNHKIVLGSKSEGEPLWKIAEWFTGKGENYVAIREANEGLGLNTRRDSFVLIPAKLLTGSAFPSPGTEVAHSKSATNPDQPLQQVSLKLSREAKGAEGSAALRQIPAAGAGNPGPSANPGPITNPGPTTPAESELTYMSIDGKDFAVYRLKKGEALYSSVAARFTGRVFAKDLNEVISRLIEVNEIEDVAKIYVDTPIRIPIELLTPEYLPQSDERRVSYEASRRESAKAARRVGAKNLDGVYIVLDAGHGGRDVGTVNGELWESTFVYDVMCRLKQLLEKKSGAKVFVTTRSDETEFKVSDFLSNRTDHAVLTKPEYVLEDATVGVNLRWYLANSIFRRAVKARVAAEKVVFISLHADSLHPSLRGAMAYVPGAEFVQGSFAKKGKIYLARAEVRESPSVVQTEEEALQAEGLSRGLAEAIIASFAQSELPVHSFAPVRENVIRDGKEWVPAVIRYNKIPTRLLLEICNFGNEDDRTLAKTKKYRQSVAKAIYAGISDFFETEESTPSEPVTAPTLRAAAK